MPGIPATIVFLFIVVAFSACSIPVIQRASESLKRIGPVQLLADIIFTTVFIYGTGASQSIFTPFLILPVIAGGLMFYRRGGLIPASAATILYGTMLGAEYLGFVPKYFQTTSYTGLPDLLTGSNQFAIYGITFFIIALISGKLAGRLRSAEKKLSLKVLELDRLSLLYKQIFDDILTGIITTNEHNYITSYNNAAEHITGYSQKEIQGRLFQDCFPAIKLTEEKERKVCTLTKKDNSSIRIGFSFSWLNMPVETSEQDQSRWKVITLQDISKIEAMERQMREAEKMATIGELSASIAHDLRNPLAAISGSAQILAIEEQNNPHTDNTQKTLVDIILRESKRMANTITEFLQFARPAEVNHEWFDVNKLFSEVIKELSPQHPLLTPDSITQETEPYLTCWGDRQQIQTVLKHLIANTLTITDTLQGTETTVRAYEQKNKKYTCIEVCDTGPGIPEDIHEKVFTPFFSTLENGTGLGLAIVKQIIDNHQGKIVITKDEAYNCIIRVLLPSPAITQEPV